MDTDITPHLTVSAAVRSYERAVADMAAGFALIAKAEADLNATFVLGEHRAIHVATYHEPVNWSEPAGTFARIRKQVWATVIERLEIRRMLSVARAKELDDQIERGELPEITAESVEQVVRGFSAALPDMLTEAVREVFDWLRPAAGYHGSEYKTNQRNGRWELGAKIILSGAVEAKWSGRGGFQVHYHRRQRFVALDNVFAALDGKGQIAATYNGPLADAVAAATGGRGETEYFRFRCFKNGNLHLEFRRMDLVQRLNEIAGGKNLKAAA